MTNTLWKLAFLLVACGTIAFDAYVETKEGLQVAAWQAHLAYERQEAGE